MEDSAVAEMWKLHVPIFLRKDGMTQWHLIWVYISVPFILVSINVIGHEFDNRYTVKTRVLNLHKRQMNIICISL